MLSRIEINNFILIQSAVLEFDKGFNVITGESGAGKSILLEAIRFAFGARGSQRLIGQWSNSAYVILYLQLEAPKFVSEYGQDIRIEHKIYKGKRVVRINDELVSLSDVQALYQSIVMDCQQSSEHFLKQPIHQQFLLDQRIDSKAIDKFNQGLKRYQVLQDTYSKFQNSLAQKDDYDIMQYHYQELSAALELDLTIAEMNELVFDNKRSSQAITLAQKLNESLIGVQRQLDHIIDLEEKSLESQAFELKDEMGTMQQYCETYVTNQAQTQLKAQQAKEVLSGLGDLARKHRVAIENLAELHTELGEKIEHIQQASERMPLLDQEITSAKTDLDQAASELLKSRQQQASILTQELINALPALGITGLNIDVQVKPPTLQKNGGQCVAILFQSVANSQSHALEQLSGGEISRVNLAVNALCSTHKVMILDEVDVGLSGEAAKKMKEFMLSLASRRQLLAISHLAQVTSGASRHFKVSKAVNDQVVSSSIQQLGKLEVLEEISRILSGGQSEIALAHAKECIES
ncbi:AAA family ATPase [Gammaproteobacteria bacterium]|nr:AAA family ATPase [Gammaproteobacteria bacterium]